ncbi:MAG TPA: PQQ-binding-like beta-propeller repeat protein [Polyangiales bacterium]|nr:PQQ-binding-like beta-propeller repeat protein [Polyangiales bacterium]
MTHEVSQLVKRMHFKIGSWLALGMALGACGSSNSGTGAPAMTSAGTLAPTTPAAGSGAASSPQPGAAGTGTATGSAGTSASADTGDVPCAVASVLKQHCVQCHGRIRKEGAPVSLIDSASFHRDAGGLSEGAAVLARVRSNERPMPPPPAARLSAAEIATLESWIGPGAQPTHPGCSVDDTPPSAAAGSGGSGVTIVNGAAGSGAGAAGGAAPPPTGSEQDWSSFGVDLTNSRNNVGEKALSVESVKGLKELWTFRGASTTCTPAVVDGVIYLTTWDGKVTAMRLDDGMKVWSTMLPDLIDSSPSVTATQVFVSDDNGSVHALDRTTGKVQWSQVVDMHAEAHLWSSPVFIPDANIVVVGVASGEEAVMTQQHTFRGSVVALEAMTGKPKWKFETAPAAKGSGPGIAVWGTVAVDTKRKAVYVGTGNNYQAPSGELSDSMLAINYETGALLWSRQFTQNDVFTVYTAMGPDFDIGSSASLFSVDGKDYVGIGVKSGIFYALDRDSGMVHWMTMVSGGSALGGMVSASAYANGMLFVASNKGIGGPTLAAALDAKDGRVVWSHELQKVTYGGVAHANGVVYVGTTAGTIVALDGAKGTMLWVDQTPENQPIAGSPSVSRGKLLVPWGYSWTLREGVAGTGGLTVYGL